MQNDLFRLVRYTNQWPVGRKRTIIRDHLDLDEAKRALSEENEHIEHEDLVIENERTGLEVAGRDRSVDIGRDKH